MVPGPLKEGGGGKIKEQTSVSLIKSQVHSHKNLIGLFLSSLIFENETSSDKQCNVVIIFFVSLLDWITTNGTYWQLTYLSIQVQVCWVEIIRVRRTNLFVYIDLLVSVHPSHQSFLHSHCCDSEYMFILFSPILVLKKTDVRWIYPSTLISDLGLGIREQF